MGTGPAAAFAASDVREREGVTPSQKKTRPAALERRCRERGGLREYTLTRLSRVCARSARVLDISHT